jgi:hypothetical protein
MSGAAAHIHDPEALVAFLLERGPNNAGAASAGFKKMADLAPDPSPESTAKLAKFVQAGGIKAIVTVMDALRTVLSTNSVQQLELIDAQEQGCILLMNLAGYALSGADACVVALRDERVAATVVKGIEQYPEGLAADLGEAGIAALMQLSILDLPSALEAGVIPVALRSLQAPKAGGWLYFLCCRTLSWCVARGGADALRAMREGGAVQAYMHALRQAGSCDPECGVPFGMPDALEQMQVVARHTLSEVSGVESGVEGDAGMSEGVLKVALFLEADAVVLSGLHAKPELNGCGGVVVVAGDGGFGPDKESARYGVKILLPLERRGTTIKVKPTNLRLAPFALAVQIEKVGAPKLSDNEYLASSKAATIASKFGELNVKIVEEPEH